MDYKDIANKAVAQFKDYLGKSFTPAEKPGGLLGVDIGSSAVKIVRRESSKEGLRVSGVAVQPIVNKNVQEALSKAIVKSGAIPADLAVIAVSGQGVVCRLIEIPLMNRAEVESAMRFEVEKYVPFPMADVTSDYSVIQEMKEKSKMSILIAAAKKDVIQRKAGWAAEVNLNLKAVDLDCLALANFATEIAIGKEKDSCYGIINVGRALSNMNILQDGVPQLTRDIFIGGDDFTKKIAEALEVEHDEAERIKVESPNKQEELLGLCDPVVNNLAGEIRVSLDYFEARSNHAVQRIYLAGGGARFGGLAQALHHLLSIEIKKVPFPARLILGEGVQRQEIEASFDFLPIALGLALR